MTTEETISKIKGLSKTQVVTIKEGDTSFDFELRPITGKLLAQMTALEGLADAQKLAQKHKAGQEITSDDTQGGAAAVWPLMKLLIPTCCINPKIIDTENTEDRKNDQLYLDELPFGILTDLLTEIFNISGLKEDAEEELVIKK